MKIRVGGMVGRALGAVAVTTMLASAGVQANAPSDESTLVTLRSGIPHEAVFGLSLDKHGHGVAVGTGGAILSSSDAGKSWERVPHELTQLALLAADKNENLSIAVGQTGTLLVSTAVGQWQKVDLGISARLLAVGVNAAGLAVVGGEFGTVLISTGNGQQWQPVKIDWAPMVTDAWGAAEPHIYGVDVSDAGVITLVGEFGLVLRSADSGKTWKAIREGSRRFASLFAVAMADQPGKPSFAVGQSGTVLRSGDGGLSWQSLQAPVEGNFLGVARAPNGRIILTGMRVMISSRDDGATWSQVRDGDATTDWYQAVKTEPGSGRIVAVGHSGKIIEIK
jgi:photosystem II stability/assembly factor-like uncharacterized protein